MKCEVCNVDIPGGEDALEVHKMGKRHMRLELQREQVEALAPRSIFAKWKACTPAIVAHELVECFKQFGKVDRIVFREGSNFAIVEFEDGVAACSARTLAEVVLRGVAITISERKMGFSSANDHIRPNIDVEAILSEVQVAPTFEDASDVIIKRMALSAEQIAQREAYSARIEQEFSTYFVNPRITIFGSSVTSIGTVDSDIDACLTLIDEDDRSGFDVLRDKYSLLTCDVSTFRGNRVKAKEMLRLTLADRARLVTKITNDIRKLTGSITQQQPLLDAKCPIVRFIADRKVLVDLSIDNMLGCAKSFFIKSLIEKEISGTLRRFLLATRFWFLTNGLFEAEQNEHKGQFNAYMVNLMCICYLQSIEAVPQFAFSSKEVRDGSWRIDFEVPQFSMESYSLSQLFKNMFVHFVSGDLHDSVMCVQPGRIMEKSNFTKGCEPSVLENFKFGQLNVQDPLELSHNVSQNLSSRHLKAMRKHMMLALSSLKRNKDNFFDFVCHKSEQKADTSSNSSELAFANEASLTVSLPASTSRSDVESLVEDIIQVLGLEPCDDAPSAKRPRSDENVENMGKFNIVHRTWIGRRNIRKKLARELSVDGITLEKEVSKQLLSSGEHSDVGALHLKLLWRNPILRIAFVRSRGDPQDFTNMTHFLDVVLKNVTVSNGSEQMET